MQVIKMLNKEIFKNLKEYTILKIQQVDIES